jgi:RNA ligase (TIGR02306 family)
MRKLASIQKVLDVVPIEGADRICSYKIQGWNVVDSVGKYAVGDLVIYCEIDSWLPTEIAPFLSKGNEPREYEGIKGERLRTVRLRGTLSQGLILPLSTIPETWDDVCSVDDLYSGEDVSELLGIIKYEPPIPACLAGEVKGLFPSFLRKTDQERIQNLSKEFESFKEYDWEVSEKCEGSSSTFYYNDGAFGVCSRNLDLKPNDNNTFWRIAVDYNIKSKLESLGKNIAIQAELCGPGIQKNYYNLGNFEIFVFDIYDIDKQQYYNSIERLHLCESLGLKHVPICIDKYKINENFSIDDILKLSGGNSKINESKEREGLVFKCIQNPSISFKSINNKYLIKSDN